MLETFSFAADAILPMVLLMTLGYCLRKKNFLTSPVISQMNKFCFRYSMSALMFCNVYAMESFRNIPFKIMGIEIISLIVLTIGGFILAWLTADKRNQKGVILQCSFRSNFAVVGLSMAAALGGQEGVALTTSLQAPTIIYFNALAVIFLTIYSDDLNQKISVRKIVLSVIKNPLIQAQLLAMGCLVLREFIPVNASGRPVFSLSGSLPWLYSFISSLSKISSPLLLLLLGAQISFSSADRIRKQLITGSIYRLILAPILGFSVFIAAGQMGLILLTPAVCSCLISIFGSPSPVAAAIMAQEMDCDGELGRQYVVWTTCLSMITLFIWVLVLRFAGLL